MFHYMQLFVCEKCHWGYIKALIFCISYIHSVTWYHSNTCVTEIMAHSGFWKSVTYICIYIHYIKLSVFGVRKNDCGMWICHKNTKYTFNHILHMKSEKKDTGRPYVRSLESSAQLHPLFVLSLLLQNYTIPLFSDTSQTGRVMGRLQSLWIFTHSFV
jgi:hypothetical protein